MTKLKDWLRTRTLGERGHINLLTQKIAYDDSVIVIVYILAPTVLTKWRKTGQIRL